MLKKLIVPIFAALSLLLASAASAAFSESSWTSNIGGSTYVGTCKIDPDRGQLVCGAELVSGPGVTTTVHISSGTCQSTFTPTNPQGSGRARMVCAPQ